MTSCAITCSIVKMYLDVYLVHVSKQLQIYTVILVNHNIMISVRDAYQTCIRFFHWMCDTSGFL